LCVAVIGALGDIGQASATDAVNKLMAKFKDSSGVQTAGEEALKKLASAPEQK
jgi:hypothetical protein